MKQSIKLILIANILTAQFFTNIQEQGNRFNINHYKNLFVLGDSLSDTGAFVQYQGDVSYKAIHHLDCREGFRPPQPWTREAKCTQIIKSWKPKTFDFPFYQNSFSNGPVAMQLVADKLNIRSFKSASYSKNEFDNFGYNYATGSAKVLTTDELWKTEFKAQLEALSLRSSRYSLVEQVIMLKQHHKIIDDRDFLTIIIGSNDIIEIIEAWLSYDFEESKQLLTKRLEKVIDIIFEQVAQLINHGFKRIFIGNIPNLSKTPRYKSNLEIREIVYDIVLKYNEAFNLKFHEFRETIAFRKKVKKINFFGIMQDVMNNFELQRMVTGKAAVDINWSMAFFFRDNFTPHFIGEATKDNLDNYAFFDDIHPTSKFHHEIGKKIYELVNDYWPIE